VLLADPDSKQLVFRHVIGVKADQLRGRVMSSDLGIAGVVFKSGNLWSSAMFNGMGGISPISMSSLVIGPGI